VIVTVTNGQGGGQS